MTRNRTYILAGVAAAAVGLAAAGAIAARGDWQHFGRQGGGGHRGGMMMGMGGFGLGIGSPLHRLCRGDAGEMTDHMLVRIEHKIKPTDAQKPAFDDLKTAMRTAAEKIEASCPAKPDPAKAAEGEKRPRLTPVERLAQTQAGLEASLEAVKTVRPAAEKFYASLSDDQKAKFNPPRWRDKGGEKPGEADEPSEKGTAPEAPSKE
jgi:LTXXQ motif family protein